MEKLNLTPEQILNNEFKTDLRGYNADEVDAFLDLILEDYQIVEENVQELLDMISSQQAEIKELNAKVRELQGQRRAFDLANTTQYSSVDLLKRISRLEEELLRK